MQFNSNSGIKFGYIGVTVDRSIDKFWTNEICSLVSLYKNLNYLNYKSYTPGKIHPRLKLNGQSARDIIRIPVKLKLMKGSYILQTNSHLFNKSQVSPTCIRVTT